MSKHEANISAVGQWFLGNALPWSDGTATKLVTLGVTCVEHLKECTDEEWDNLFLEETVITRRVATRVFAGLKNDGELDPKKCASQLGIAQASCAPPPLLSLSRRGRNKDDGTSLKLTDLGITVKSISKATKKRIRLSTVAAARAAVVDIMDSAKEGEEALPGNLYGGAGDADSGLGSVSKMDDDKVGNDAADETGGDISDSECEEEEDAGAGGERPSRRIQSWRDGRCLLSKDLNEPSTSNERITWDNDLVGIGDGCEDLEDPEGYYAVMGCYKESSDSEIARHHKRLRKKYQSLALKCHPDKTKDVRLHNKFLRADAKWKRVSCAFGVLGKVDDSGCYVLRVDYDLDGERRREVMEEVCCLCKRILVDFIKLFTNNNLSLFSIVVC
jgi:hypothetical protein